MELCPVCANGVELAGPAPTIITCPACATPFVPESATAVQLAARAGGLREVREVDLPASFCERYRLEARIGSGTMGTVYRARVRADSSLVAVKFFMRQDHPDALARFLREGRLLLAVRHANVVAVREVHEIGGHPYFISEYVAGGTLRQRIDEGGALDPVEAVGLVCDVLSGLQACHEQGIVHRDVKPANVLLDGSAAKLADLGVAKAYGDGEANLTRTGALLGTPTYMAPEQARGEPVGVAADLYSVGIVLYEMLCGHPPFQETSLQAQLHAQQTQEPPPLLAEAPGVPEPLAAAVHRALAKRAADRPASARDLAAALEQAVGAVVPGARSALSPPSPSAPRNRATPDRPPGPWRILTAFTVLGLVLLVAISRETARPGGGIAPLASRNPAPPSQAPAAEVEEVRALKATLESEPFALAPWIPPPRGAPAEVDCPLVLTCLAHLTRLRVQPGAGCRVLSVNGAPLARSAAGLMAPRGENLTVLSPAAHQLEEGLNWVRLRAEAGHEPRAIVYQDRTPCPTTVSERALPPQEVAAYNRVNSALYHRVPAQTAAARAAIAREYPDPADPGRRAALVRVDALDDDLVIVVAGVLQELTDDPLWTEPSKLVSMRSGMVTLQDALRRNPARWDLWHDLGGLMRKCGQPAAARPALIRALSLWPGAYWSWRDLAALERRTWKQGDRRFEDRRKAALRHVQFARRFYLASGLTIFWMIPELDNALLALDPR